MHIGPDHMSGFVQNPTVIAEFKKAAVQRPVAFTSKPVTAGKITVTVDMTTRCHCIIMTNAIQYYIINICMSFTPVTFEEAIEAKRITLPTGDPDCLDKAVLRSLIAKLSNPFGTNMDLFYIICV